VKLIDVSTRAGWPAYAGIGLMIALLVWVLIAPDKAWRLERVFVAWQYRDGDRIELSSAGRAWARFSSLVGIVVLLVVAGQTVNWSASSRVRTEALPGGQTIYHVDVVDSPGCTVRIFVCLRTEAVFPIEVTDYEELDAKWGRDGVPVDTDLLLRVPDRFFPTHLVMSEGDSRVTVSLFGRCTPRYSWDDAVGSSAADCGARSSFPADFPGLVPVTLSRPLGDRQVLDGHGDAPIEPHT
jgi:hypothetical protein